MFVCEANSAWEQPVLLVYYSSFYYVSVSIVSRAVGAEPWHDGSPWEGCQLVGCGSLKCDRKPSLDTIHNWPVSIFTHALMLSTSTRRRFYERFLTWCQDSQQLLAWLARILMITELWFNWLDFFEDLCFLGEEAVSASRRQYFALLRPVCHVLKNQGTTTVYTLKSQM